MFHPELVSFMKLLERSEDAGDGWRSYSNATRRLVLMNEEKFPGLFEVDALDMRVRLTAEGNTLMKWMNFVPVKEKVVG